MSWYGIPERRSAFSTARDCALVRYRTTKSRLWRSWVRRVSRRSETMRSPSASSSSARCTRSRSPTAFSVQSSFSLRAVLCFTTPFAARRIVCVDR